MGFKQKIRSLEHDRDTYFLRRKYHAITDERKNFLTRLIVSTELLISLYRKIS